MRMLLTSVPGLGHLHPVLPLALAAARAGHEMRVVTGADRVPWVRRCGLPAQPAGLPLDGLRQRAAARGLTGPEPGPGRGARCSTDRCARHSSSTA